MEVSQLRNICNINFGCIGYYGNIKQFVNLIIYLYLCLMDIEYNHCYSSSNPIDDLAIKQMKQPLYQITNYYSIIQFEDLILNYSYPVKLKFSIN